VLYARFQKISRLKEPERLNFDLCGATQLVAHAVETGFFEKKYFRKVMGKGLAHKFLTRVHAIYIEDQETLARMKNQRQQGESS
jgi:hypothetical protein